VSIDDFARTTRKVIAEAGLDDYLPTVLYPIRAHIAALEGAPDGPDLEAIVLDWATKGAIGDEEFLVAFKVASDKFKVIRRHGGQHESAIFDIASVGG
jgi:hypothetical protein